MRFQTFMLNEISNAAIAKAKIHLSDLARDDSIDIDDYLARFKTLQDKGKIHGVDILAISPQKLKEIVDRSEITKSKKEISDEIKAGTKKIYENDRAIVIEPSTYEASCKYGKGTKWCTAAKTTKKFFDVHTENGYFYYVIPKNNDTKFAVTFNPIKGIEIFDDGDNEKDSDDKYYTLDHLKKRFGIPKSVFFNIQDNIYQSFTNEKGHEDARLIPNPKKIEHQRLISALPGSQAQLHKFFSDK